ncbi:ANTAR domain-containing protein [Arthrobacter sp. CAN_A214]|uniref:ANTAR domain-containing protein n=1 Tax=Arthrobacter sp. CAN_A214 TaxID=2787720 RepID=UPI002FEEDC07
MRLAVRIAQLTETSDNLRSAMTSRTTIDLAAGIIMGQNRCSHDAAMTILKAASSARNTKLRDVATQVLASVGQQPPETHFDN